MNVEPNRAAEPMVEAESAQRSRATASFFSSPETLVNRVERAALASFGRYTLVRLLGKGGMGEVHLAEDAMLRRTVALKVPRFQEDDRVHHERFLREARTVAKLSHPNICPVYDVNEWEGKPYLTMAYIQGPSLAQRLRENGPLPPREAVRLVLALARAMRHAHEQGILHRDLKPGNVLLNPQGEPILMDFGLAIHFDAPTADRLTQDGLIVGTPAYMPPEQVNNQALSPATDVYSLGVVLYELLTGRVPFTGTLGQVLAKIENAAPAPPRTLRPEVEAGLEAICLKALAKRPEDRFGDMGGFAQVLEEYLSGQPIDLPTVAWRRPSTPWYRRGTVLAGAFLGIVLASAALYLPRLPGGPDKGPMEPKDKDAPPAALVFPPGPPVDDKQKDLDHLYAQMGKSLLKVTYTANPGKAQTVGRGSIPPAALKGHEGTLLVILKGSGEGHAIDLTDQGGQVAQVQDYSGEAFVAGPYITFIANLPRKTRLFIEASGPVSMLIPIISGEGSGHVEYDGTHVLLPKTAPKTEVLDATREEQAALRNPLLTKKIIVSQHATRYTLFTRPETAIVSGNVAERAKQFPLVHSLLERDRDRQMHALSITVPTLEP